MPSRSTPKSRRRKPKRNGIELDLKYCEDHAPIWPAKSARPTLTEGNLVNAGGSDPLLTTIVAIDPIYVDFNVDERAMQRYQEIDAGRQDKDKQQSLREQKIPFSFGLDTEKGFPHEGHLVFADNKYAEGTGTILVRGEAKNPDGRLIPGSRVRVRVPVSDKYEATLVPDTAVNTDQNQKYLLVVGEDNIVKRQNVRLGRLLDDGMRVILKPKLKADEWIIVEGMERARLNYPVEPVPESAGSHPIHQVAHPQHSLFARSDPIQGPASGPFPCYRISSSTGRSSPRCCPSSS